MAMSATGYNPSTYNPYSSQLSSATPVGPQAQTSSSANNTTGGLGTASGSTPSASQAPPSVLQTLMNGTGSSTGQPQQPGSSNPFASLFSTLGQTGASASPSSSSSPTVTSTQGNSFPQALSGYNPSLLNGIGSPNSTVSLSEQGANTAQQGEPASSTLPTSQTQPSMGEEMNGYESGASGSSTSSPATDALQTSSAYSSQAQTPSNPSVASYNGQYTGPYNYDDTQAQINASASQPEQLPDPGNQTASSTSAGGANQFSTAYNSVPYMTSSPSGSSSDSFGTYA